MKTKKEYVSPRLIRVKLEPSQAVLSQCTVGATSHLGGDFCNPHHNWKGASGGDSAAGS